MELLMKSELRMHREEDKLGYPPSKQQLYVVWIRRDVITLGFVNSQKGQSQSLLAWCSAGGISHIYRMSLGRMYFHSEVIETGQIRG